MGMTSFECWTQKWQHLRMPSYRCEVCSQWFSRKYNMERHMASAHPQYEDESMDVEQEDESEEEGVSEEENDSEDETSEESGDSEESEDEEDTGSIWDHIKEDAWTDDLQMKYNIRCKELEQLGIQDPSHAAAQDMKPYIQENVRILFRDKMADMLALKRDPIYRKIMVTYKQVQDEEIDFDEDEVWDYALKKRQYLLDRAVGISKGVNISEFDGSEEEKEED